jgi:hypothetical protein
MTEARETIIQELQDMRVVINAKDVQGAIRFGLSHVPVRLIDGWQMLPGNLWQSRIGDYGRPAHFKTGLSIRYYSVSWKGGAAINTTGIILRGHVGKR